MTEGRYLYCILDGKEKCDLGHIGLFDKKAYTVNHKDISAVVSPISFKELQPDIKTITAHQRVVEESRNRGTTLPIRFGILFKTEDGVKTMLSKSYVDFKTKIKKLDGKDEYGLKIVIEKSNLSKLESESQQMPEIKKMKQEIRGSGKGAAYFLQMKIDEAIKTETYKKIDTISGNVHKDLTATSTSNCLLKNDLEQVILNSAYLVDKKQSDIFIQKVEDLKQKYDSFGLIFHLSGPWAPYSFC